MPDVNQLMVKGKGETSLLFVSIFMSMTYETRRCIRECCFQEH